MDFLNINETVQGVIRISKGVAREYGNASYAPSHLLYALMRKEAGLQGFVESMGKDAEYIREWAEVRIEEYPKTSGNGDSEAAFSGDNDPLRAALKPELSKGNITVIGATTIGLIARMLSAVKMINQSGEKDIKEFSGQLACIEAKEEHSAALLLGVPPEYVGYEEGGVLVNRIRRQPYAVVLFDETEKAHSSVYDIFLQIMNLHPPPCLQDDNQRGSDCGKHHLHRSQSGWRDKMECEIIK